jgi:hypothetical protein
MVMVMVGDIKDALVSTPFGEDEQRALEVEWKQVFVYLLIILLLLTHSIPRGPWVADSVCYHWLLCVGDTIEY